MRTITIILLLCAGLLACQKDPELTFPEYYSCLDHYQDQVEQANNWLTAKQITQSKYNAIVAAAKYSYDSCIKVGEGNK